VRVTVDAYPNRSFSGQVMKIEPQARVEQNVTMFPVLVQLENPERLLLPGMNADVEISIGERRGATALPNGAVMNPRDAQSAALALGINEDAYRQALAAAGSGGRGGPAAAGGRGPAAGAALAPGEPAPEGTATPTAAAEGAPPELSECTEIFQRMRGGGGQNALSAADRTQLESCRATMAATMGGGQRGGAMRPGGNRGGQSDTRTAVVFVATETGTQPRMVTLGLNDLDYSEVVRGVEPGEHVVLLAGIQLLQQQQQQLDRMRERTSGMPGAPTVGGPGGGRIR
jgi:HlyD family secretion protein